MTNDSDPSSDPTESGSNAAHPAPRPILNQSTWRRMGLLSILGATLMAIYAGTSGLLRDTVIHGARLFSGDDLDLPEAESNLWLCLVYWAFFGCTILVALYMALLDIRYIRLEYALARQRLFQDSLSAQATARHGSDEDRE